MADHDYFQFVTPDWDVITATHRVLRAIRNDQRSIPS